MNTCWLLSCEIVIKCSSQAGMNSTNNWYFHYSLQPLVATMLSIPPMMWVFLVAYWNGTTLAPSINILNPVKTLNNTESIYQMLKLRNCIVEIMSSNMFQIKVGIGSCLQICCITSSVNCIPLETEESFQILAWSRISTAEQFMVRQKFSMGDKLGLHAGQFSTWILSLRSLAL